MSSHANTDYLLSSKRILQNLLLKCIPFFVHTTMTVAEWNYAREIETKLEFKYKYK